MNTITKHLLWGLMSASLLLPTTAADTFSFSVNPGFDDVGMEVITGYDGCEKAEYWKLKILKNE